MFYLQFEFEFFGRHKIMYGPFHDDALTHVDWAVVLMNLKRILQLTHSSRSAACPS